VRTSDDRTLHELYLWPFADAVKAGVGSVMTAYNAVNGSACSQNSYLLNGLLKDELGFQGFVMSDWLSRMSKDYSVFLHVTDFYRNIGSLFSPSRAGHVDARRHHGPTVWE